MKQTQLILVLLLTAAALNSQVLLEDKDFSDSDIPYFILNEGFNSGSFPPSGWSSQLIAGTINWSVSNYGAYCNSPRSAIMPFRSASGSQIARLISPVFSPTGSVYDSLFFNEAYCMNPPITESLEIFVSTNSGTTWLLLTTYSGSSLSTAPATSGNFVPLCNQWQGKSLYLPLNTNRLFFQAVGGAGNNLYVDDINISPSLLTGLTNYSNEIPDKFKLNGNYPNPFNPETNIRFDLNENSFVSLKIYDINGKLVEVLTESNLKPGKYEIKFNGSKLSSGIYIINLSAGNHSESMKMVLTK